MAKGQFLIVYFTFEYGRPDLDVNETSIFQIYVESLNDTCNSLNTRKPEICTVVHFKIISKFCFNFT